MENIIENGPMEVSNATPESSKPNNIKVIMESTKEQTASSDFKQNEDIGTSIDILNLIGKEDRHGKTDINSRKRN